MPISEIKHERFTWTNITQPTAADIDRLRVSHPHISALNLEDMLSHTERPKIDEDEDYIFVVMHFPVWDAAHRLSRPSEVEFVLGRRTLVTAHEGSLKPLTELFARCQQDGLAQSRVFSRGANDGFYYIVDQLVDYIFPILGKVDSNIHMIEDRIFTANARQVITDIALVRRDIIALRRIIRHLVPILEQLRDIEHPIIREELEEYFGDTVDHIYRARDIIDEDAEIIAGLAETANQLISNRTNEIVRILTVISVLILPLTFITGVYGMNIDLPLDEHPEAFIFVVGLMLAISTFMLLYFKRRKWI